MAALFKLNLDYFDWLTIKIKIIRVSAMLRTRERRASATLNTYNWALDMRIIINISIARDPALTIVPRSVFRVRENWNMCTTLDATRVKGVSTCSSSFLH